MYFISTDFFARTEKLLVNFYFIEENKKTKSLNKIDFKPIKTTANKQNRNKYNCILFKDFKKPNGNKIQIVTKELKIIYNQIKNSQYIILSNQIDKVIENITKALEKVPQRAIYQFLFFYYHNLKVNFFSNFNYFFKELETLVKVEEIINFRHSILKIEPNTVESIVHNQQEIDFFFSIKQIYMIKCFTKYIEDNKLTLLDKSSAEISYLISNIFDLHYFNLSLNEELSVIAQVFKKILIKKDLI
jgi:hypothetical protein